VSVVVVTDLFQPSGLQPVSFVDDEQLGEAGGPGLGVDERVDLAMGGVVDGVGDLLASPRDFLVDLLAGGGDGGRPQRRSGVEDPRRDGVGVDAEVALPLFPLIAAGVVASGKGLPDTGWPQQTPM
jgi:hypothetical protein